MNHELSIAILLPCYNEEGAIGETVIAFKSALPNATVYVYDNNSTDGTVTEAISSGAHVYKEERQGKGKVVRRMFSDVDADVYLMADGDNTYDAAAAPLLVKELISNNLDMVVGTRTMSLEAYPKGHILGNKLFTKLISMFFGTKLNDVFSGYRVMSKRFVKTVPIFSHGFEIETELTVHALHHSMSIKEVPTDYKSRPEGTSSKLKTFSDGAKILNFIFFLLRDVKPLQFFSTIAAISMLMCLILGLPVVAEFWRTGLVERLPTAVLSSALGVIAISCLFSGFILDNISRLRVEAKILHYLSYNASKNSGIYCNDEERRG